MGRAVPMDLLGRQVSKARQVLRAPPATRWPDHAVKQARVDTPVIRGQRGRAVNPVPWSAGVRVCKALLVSLVNKAPWAMPALAVKARWVLPAPRVIKAPSDPTGGWDQPEVEVPR